MKNIIQVHIYKGDTHYIAEGVDLPIVTQAKTLDELATNIQEAIALHLEGEDLSELNFSPNPSVLMNVELPTQDVIVIVKSLGFEVHAQRGSHIKVKRIVNGESQTLTVPNHDEMDKGTLKAIFNQASKYVAPDDLRKHFYTI
jgi:predicted RNA binding protein YcfA (HicA-like mRNA interferase family)/predicted RNase H-like HicB family nuclease